jgi:hypothetical protein
MFCTNCGGKINEGAQFCTFCGTAVHAATAVITGHEAPALPPVPFQNRQEAGARPPVMQPFQQQINIHLPPESEPRADIENRRLRHGFTSFWLWIIFIANIAGLLALLIDFFSDGEFMAEWFHGSSDFDKWVIRIACILSFWAAKKLLFDWEKSGFWLTVIVNVVFIFLNPLKQNEEDFYTGIIIQAVSIGILFGVLQFKNAYNAKSTWEQLY